METYQITAPENLNFNQPEVDEHFRLVSVLSEQDEANQMLVL